MSTSFDSNEALLTLIHDECEVLQQAGLCLQKGIDGIPAQATESAQGHYVQEQAKSVAAVALDVALLVKNERLQNIAGLCRVAFESRISIYAAMRVPGFAAQKYLGQTLGQIRELEEYVKGSTDTKFFHAELEHHRHLLQQMRQDYGGVKERAWKFKETAEAAGLIRDYDENYSWLSKAAHNTPTGLAAKDDPFFIACGVLRLLHDTLETAYCLVFFRERDDAAPQPITKNWEVLSATLKPLRVHYYAFSSRLDVLTSNTFN